MKWSSQGEKGYILEAWVTSQGSLLANDDQLMTQNWGWCREENGKKP